MYEASKNALTALGLEAGERIVYVREVAASEIEEAEVAQTGAPAESAKLYAVHDGAGNRLGLFSDRATAFYVSRQHELAPVSVH